MNRLAWALVVGGALGVLGCDSGPSAEDKCQTLTTAYAARVADCMVELACVASANRDATYQQLITGIDAMMPNCSNVIGVEPSYDRCLSETKAVDCMAYADASTGTCRAAPLAIDCAGVLLYR